MPSGRSTTGEHAGAAREEAREHGAPGALHALRSGAGSLSARAAAGASAVGDAASSATHAAGFAASSAADSLSDAATSLGGLLGSAAGRLGTRSRRGLQGIQHTSHQATDRGGDLAHPLVEAAKEHPLLTTALALGVGALLGGLIPESRAEDRLMGEQAQELRAAAAAKAAEAARAAKHRGGELAAAAAERGASAAEHLKHVALGAKDDLVQAVTQELNLTSEEAKHQFEATVPTPEKTQAAIDQAVNVLDERTRRAGEAADAAIPAEAPRHGD